ncbi:universal stress protein [Mucisphaera calidilacus]|uniref:Universal stress protein family protein n=1 Tax=Mucisphaera calidilacus TaxID=2527982 RepID=A0A518BVF0_9BACT|nr:universal stress protein [Mucisphaera calidilacus]QDU70931.1 Universal stress protein family protein [Mucisphaera calidilacus]
MPDSRILIAVSSPWASEKLVRPMADLAKRLNASVVVAHVAMLMDDEETEEQASERGEQTLATLTDGLSEHGIESEGIMLYSDHVAKAILNTASKYQCSMIVLGLTGRGVLKRMISGDVPSNIIRNATIPVLLCPATWEGLI